MARGRSRRHGGEYGVFWPGYVDVLSTLLLVVTFLMSIFMLAQYFASQEATRQGHRAQEAHAADRRADQPALARKGQEPSRLRTSSPLCRRRCRRCARRTRGCRAPRCRATRRRRLPRRASPVSPPSSRAEEDLRRGAGQGRPAQPAASALRRQIAALNEALEASEKKDPGEPDAHQGSGLAPQRGARPSGAGAAALPLRLLRPPARAAEETARTSASSATASCSNPRCCSPPAQAS